MILCSLSLINNLLVETKGHHLFDSWAFFVPVLWVVLNQYLSSEGNPYMTYSLRV